MTLGLIELLVLFGLPAFFVLALLGRRATPPDGTALVVNGRPAAGGRGHAIVRRPTLIMPFVEAAELVSLIPLPISISRRVRDCEGTEHELTLAARVRLPDDPASLLRSLELLGGRAPRTIEALSHDALEGTLVHVIAGVHRDEIRADLEGSVRVLRERAQDALRGLGLELDGLSLSPAR